jgi:RimJ/RimL family protein N-acetyltransferase
MEPTLRLLKWTPSLTAAAPTALELERNGFRKNWLFYLPAIVASPARAYSVFMLMEGATVVSQCIVTSSSSRFPFMEKDAWQVGLVATAESFLRKGMAARMLNGVLQDLGATAPLWWITEPANAPSRRLAESAGFAPYGHAARNTRFGVFPFFELISTAR